MLTGHEPSDPQLTAVRIVWDDPLTANERARVIGWAQRVHYGLAEKAIEHHDMTSDAAGNLTVWSAFDGVLPVEFTRLVAMICQIRVIERDVPFTVQLAD